MRLICLGCYSFADESPQESDDPDSGGGNGNDVRDALFTR